MGSLGSFKRTNWGSWEAPAFRGQDDCASRGDGPVAWVVATQLPTDCCSGLGYGTVFSNHFQDVFGRIHGPSPWFPIFPAQLAAQHLELFPLMVHGAACRWLIFNQALWKFGQHHPAGLLLFWAWEKTILYWFGGLEQFLFFPYIGNFIIPTDYSNICQRGLENQPVYNGRLVSALNCGTSSYFGDSEMFVWYLLPHFGNFARVLKSLVCSTTETQSHWFSPKSRFRGLAQGIYNTT